MRAIWHWLRSWYIAARQYRTLGTHERALTRAMSAREAAHARIQAGIQALTQAREEFNAKADKIALNLQDAARHHKAFENAIDALRAELEVATQVTIPTLAASHKLLLGRIDADLAVQARRTATATIQGQQDG